MRLFLIKISVADPFPNTAKKLSKRRDYMCLVGWWVCTLSISLSASECVNRLISEQELCPSNPQLLVKKSERKIQHHSADPQYALMDSKLELLRYDLEIKHLEAAEVCHNMIIL